MKVQTITNRRNPILPLDIHLADSEAHVMKDGTMYLYGSCDEKENQYCSTRYHIVETKDMETWNVYHDRFSAENLVWEKEVDVSQLLNIDLEHPTPFLKKVMNEDAEVAEMVENENQDKTPLLYAPDATYFDGKYYLFFCMVGGLEGVAESESPIGPFRHARMLPCKGIDPTVYIEGEKIYYFWGQFYLHGAELNKTFDAFVEETEKAEILSEEEHFFHEGASLRKIGNKYYLVFADIEHGKPTSLGYAISDSIFGPYEYKGVIIDNEGCDPKTWNNHGSIECFQGQWYVFYHRSSRNSRQFRRLCIEPITIFEDGTISMVKMTSQGIGGPFQLSEQIMGYQVCQMKGNVYIDQDEWYGEKLTNIQKNDEICFRYFQVKEKIKGIYINCRGNAVIELFFNQYKIGEYKLSDNQAYYPLSFSECGIYEVTWKIREVDHFEILLFQFY